MKKFIVHSILFSGIILSSCNTGRDGSGEMVGTDSLSHTPIPIELETSEKKTLLTELIGEYSLQSIDGFAGANTMMEYRLLEGNWSASGSSTTGGVREGYDLDLSKEDLKKLKSAKIVVAEDLSVSYLCDEVNYFKTPFKEDGMEFDLSQAPKEYYSAGMPENLSVNSTFEGDYLYLYAKDKISAQELEPADIAQVMADAILLKYNETDKTFELTLFFGDCCDNSIYTFK